MAIDSDGGRCVSADIAAGVSPAAALFHSLADQTRLRIVQRLARGEARVVDLTAELGLAQSTISKHLACLRDCGLVDYRAEGRQSFYSLTRPELMDLLSSAEKLLAATGHAVALCPVHGVRARGATAGQAEVEAEPEALGRAGGKAVS
jgi:ArsR family transcriptional regulator